MRKLILTLLLSLFLATPVFATDYGADANCMGYWEMEINGDETDSSGEGMTLTETSGDIPQSATKKQGTYSRDFELDDTEHLERSGNGEAIDISGADQAISMVGFVKFESNATDLGFINRYDANGNRRQYQMYWNQTEDTYQCTLGYNGGASATTALAGSSDYDDLAWHHIGCVYNDTDIRIYQDGSLDSNGASNPKAYTSGISGETTPFSIGTTMYAGTHYSHFDGLIDDVALFDRELTSVEMADINSNCVDGTCGAVVTRRIMLISQLKEELKRQGYGFKYYWES